MYELFIFFSFPHSCALIIFLSIFCFKIKFYCHFTWTQLRRRRHVLRQVTQDIRIILDWYPILLIHCFQLPFLRDVVMQCYLISHQYKYLHQNHCPFNKKGKIGFGQDSYRSLSSNCSKIPCSQINGTQKQRTSTTNYKFYYNKNQSDPAQFCWPIFKQVRPLLESPTSSI